MIRMTFADCSQCRRAGAAVIAVCLAWPPFGAGQAAAQSQSPSAARAATPGLTQNFSANASKPVDIEAASLLVDDKKKTATFSGKVVVVQGDVKLRADEIVIHYTSTDKSAANGAKASAVPAALTGGTGGSTDISTIDATGNVLVTTVNDQNVSGEHATYDVKAQTIVVWGEKVVVSQGKSILHGQKLTVNVVDGTYRMDSGSQNRLSFKVNPMELKEQADAMKAQGEAAKAKPETKPEAKPKKKPAEPAQQPSPQQGGSWRVDSPDQ